jgi:hypothetical protein
MTDTEFLEFIGHDPSEDNHDFIERVGIIMNDSIMEETDAQLLAYSFVYKEK